MESPQKAKPAWENSSLGFIEAVNYTLMMEENIILYNYYNDTYHFHSCPLFLAIVTRVSMKRRKRAPLRYQHQTVPVTI